MTYALMSSGGKDSTLALDRARRQGLDVRFLANLYDRASGRVRFHGVRATLISDQADALGLTCVQAAAGEDDFDDAFATLLDSLRQRGCEGVVFGNIHLADVREWYETRVRALGLDHVEPLWGEPPIELVYEVIERGYRAVIVGVDAHRGAAPFLGRELDADVVTELGITEGLDPAGERGEYHTFVYDGPAFTAPVAIEIGTVREEQGHRLLDLLPRKLGARLAP
jgi:uncharacterized protein (TIGR00290 family)